MYVETMDAAKDITVENIMNKVTEWYNTKILNKIKIQYSQTRFCYSWEILKTRR